MNVFVAEITTVAASIGAGGGGGRRSGGGASGQKDAAMSVGNRGAAMVDADGNSGTAAIDESVVEMRGVNAEVAHEGQG